MATHAHKIMTTRARRKEITRERILDAALALLGEGRSLDSLGLREVARTAGLAPTSLYNHFPDMEALGLALVDRACFRLRTRMREGRRELMASDAEQAIRGMVERFVAWLGDHETEFRLLVLQRLGASPRYRRRIQGEMELLVEELAADVGRVVDERVGLPVDVLREAEAAVAVVFGFGILALDASPAERQARLPHLETQLQMIFLGGRALAAGARLASPAPSE